MTFWYLASPYSKYPLGLEDAFRAVCRARGLLVAAGIPCFAPIIHSHPVAEHGGLDPLDHNIWLPSERPIMDAAAGLIVLRICGWDTSYGVGVEMDFFRAKGLPIVFMDPGVVPGELFE